MGQANWYVVRTQANKEDWAEANLRKQGFSVFTPRYRKRRRHARKVDVVLKPLFPNYLFVHIDMESQPWRRINGTRGVCNVIAHGGLPTPVPPAVVQAILDRQGDDGLIQLNTPCLMPGQPIRLEEGPMADFEGIFLEMADTERAILLISFMGREVRTRVSTSWVCAA